MKSLTTTAEDVARSTWESVKFPDAVRVHVPVERMGRLYLPRAEGEELIEAIFRVFSFGDNFSIERATVEKIPVGEMGGEILTHDPNEFRRLMLKKNLLAWSLDIPIERKNDWMTPECYARVGKVGAPLLDALLDEFQKTMSVTEDEDKMIDRQSSILFSENSSGVANACEAVNMYCTLGSFWEKFGLGRESLPDLPFREYMMLKIMMRKEGESMKTRTRNKAAPSTKVIGPGGRARASSGKKIAL